MPDPHTIHLVRHGEVSNPNHVVYGDLPGFHLSAHGVLQAHLTGIHLSGGDIDYIISSPLTRAVETSTSIARHHLLDPVIDDRLTESGQFPHWTGNRWEDVPTLFPDELELYLADASAAGGMEPLDRVADRYSTAIGDALDRGRSTIVVIGHQDPIQAVRLTMTGRELSELRDLPPSHAEVITLSRSSNQSWNETSRWAPMESTG